MVEREKIVTQVRKIVKKNNLEQSFLPLIEEFFFRANDQYDWNDYDFNIAINNFEKVSIINFVNCYYKYNCHSGLKPNFKKNILSVFFNIYDLKGIFEYSQSTIDNFINCFMHEFGHVIQIQSKMQYSYINKEVNNLFITGFNVFAIDDNLHDILFSTGSIANEYAEVINATRLQKGNISSESYLGYEDIHRAGKVMISSLGLTEMEYSSLQLKGKSYYESFVSNRLGKIPSKIYINSFQKILDCIYNFSDDMFQRKNLLAQIDALQTLSQKLFEERFENINLNSNAGLIELAKLIIDKDEKDNSLMQLFDEYKIETHELQIKEDIDIYTKLSDLGYDDAFLLKLHDIEYDERIKIQRQTEKQNEKEYNNEELREIIYHSLLRYPIKDIPIIYRPGIMLSKMIGKIKRRNLNKNPNLLVSGNTYNDKHSKFVSRIANLEEYGEIACKSKNISESMSRKDSTHEISR